jgi:sialic acid synthase SpsE/mannose-6-phosphate isomerase-like protein (cupin superfamily)
MAKGFDYKNLFIFDLANNHMGDMAHAERVIREVAAVAQEAGVRAALKFQFRQLDTFIHPDFKDRMDLKFIKRFSETRLEMDQFRELADIVRDCGMLTMSTPFDEASVDVICDMDLDIIKIASCSADDRPLIEKVARVNRPIVVSTAGLASDEIDWLVNYLQSERADFALMHCVAQYPTPDDRLDLDQVRQLKDRFRDVSVGWSTHEDQDNVSAVQIAYALGASLFERHVGVPTETYGLNAYSSSPPQLARWLDSFNAARAMLGAPERAPAALEERQTLRDLKRGTFMKRAVKAGDAIKADDVFFAIPFQDGQLASGQFRDGMIAAQDYDVKAPLTDDASYAGGDKDAIFQIMLQVRGILNTAGIYINNDAEIEISHHYGLARFREFGAVLITCVNRAYAKKLVVQLPRQKHPYHFHKQKEETFQLLAGDVEIIKDGHPHSLLPGDTLLVEPGEWHKFHTLEGCVFEEISSTAYVNDSFYQDRAIDGMSREARKTKVDHWAAYFMGRSRG